MKSKVKAKWVVKIPTEAQILVKEHEYVSKGDSLVAMSTETTKTYDMSVVLAKISPQKIEELKINLENRIVKEGDLLYETGGMFSKKIYAPTSGIFKKIDEFYNVQFLIQEEAKKNITSPVKSQVSKIEEEKLVLEFDAVEFSGESIVEGKVWGETNFEQVEKIGDLNSRLAGKIIMVDKFNQAFALKAEVVGVVAIVTKMKKEESENIEVSLPVLSVDNEEWNELSNFRSFDEKKQVLLNSKVGRLLMVVE